MRWSGLEEGEESDDGDDEVLVAIATANVQTWVEILFIH